VGRKLFGRVPRPAAPQENTRRWLSSALQAGRCGASARAAVHHRDPDGKAVLKSVLFQSPPRKLPGFWDLTMRWRELLWLFV
jgi:hypothetical protein